MECSHKTYNIYCDESTHLENDGQPYMIYGYVSIPYNEMALAKKQIREIKQKHGFLGIVGRIAPPVVHTISV